MIDKNYPHFSWVYMNDAQKNILRTLDVHRSFIFIDSNKHIFNFVCKESNADYLIFDVFTIPDQWLIGEYKLEK